jgi:hypothetical protein
LVASTELDIVVSGSVDATCIVHTLARGQYVRCIRHPLHFPVDRIALSAHDGSFVIYSNMADAHEQRVTPYPTKYAICDRTATALFGRVVYLTFMHSRGCMHLFTAYPHGTLFPRESHRRAVAAFVHDQRSARLLGEFYRQNRSAGYP